EPRHDAEGGVLRHAHRGHVTADVPVFGGEPDADPDAAADVAQRQRHAVQDDAARVGFALPGEHFGELHVTGAIQPGQAHALARPQREVDVVDLGGGADAGGDEYRRPVVPPRPALRLRALTGFAHHRLDQVGNGQPVEPVGQDGLAVTQHGHRVAHLEDLVQVVGDVDDGD